MIEFDEKELSRSAYNARRNILKMSTNGGTFTGSAMSCVDVLIYLYKNFLNINADNLNDVNRDYFFLSKGHSVAALYAVLAEVGILENVRLSNHLKEEDSFYWHPNASIPGIEYHSGSLGHLLPVAIGVALDCKMKKSNNKVVVLLGDGELNEGSNWEALLIASAYKLDNLVIIIDRNKFQANTRTEELIPLKPLVDKFISFGCYVKKCDGHSFESMYNTFSDLDSYLGRPIVVIAKTKRGKGNLSMENQWNKWFCNFSETELEEALMELDEQTILEEENE